MEAGAKGEFNSGKRSFNHKVCGLAYNQNAILATEGNSMSENGITRRQFIERTVAGAAATSLAAGARPSKGGVSPNEKITMGIIGAGIRGQEDMQSVVRVGGNVAVVCDLYDGHLRRAQEILLNVPVTRDYREVL